jgi:hypothetical protein
MWEDTMAASVARNLEDDIMVVLAGSGHIIYKFDDLIKSQYLAGKVKSSKFKACEFRAIR